MVVSLSTKKIDEALRLTEKARELLIRYGHSRRASTDSIVHIQDTLRAILQYISLMQAYDKTPYRCGIYGHVSQTFLNVLDLQPEGNSFGDRSRQSDQATHGHEMMETRSSFGPKSAEAQDDVSDVILLPQINDGINVRWADIAGCEEAIAALKLATVLPMRFPQFFQGSRRPSRRVLLYGPPGTGKTLLAAAAAAEYAAPLLTISSADIFSKWIGESERHVRRVFEAAIQLPRCILFFDELDAICSTRGGSGETEASRRIKTELLLRMQSADCEKVTIVGATNMPWDLDSAFLRRFDQLIFVGLPSASARRQIIMSELEHVPHILSDGDFQWLVDSTNGYSSSDVRKVAQHAVMDPIHHLTQAGYVRSVPVALSVADASTSHASNNTHRYVPCSEEDEGALPLYGVPATELSVPEVCRRNFETSLREFHPTVSAKELEKFLQWRSCDKRPAT